MDIPDLGVQAHTKSGAAVNECTHHQAPTNRVGVAPAGLFEFPEPLMRKNQLYMACCRQYSLALQTLRPTAMDFLLDPNLWIAFGMLTALEIVLGIDNIIFISILVGRLPPEQRERARRMGLGFAMITRVMLLLSLSWVMGLTADLFNVFGQGISGRDLVLLLGGIFLLYKASHEIFVEVEAREQDNVDGMVEPTAAARKGVFWAVIGQIAIIDIVFSLDSVITAVGMVDQVSVMIAAVIAAVGVMLVAAKTIGDFVDQHPSVKVLALAFLVMVGMALTAEAFDVHVPKGYIYASMAFSLAVEALNIRARGKRLAAKSA
jgi:predicted tellurium resistance membrane protein TerC